MKKTVAVAALLGLAGAAGVADAAPVAAKLVKVTSYSPNGPSVWNRTLDTSTWTFDAANSVAVQTGGTYSALAKAGASPLMRHTMTGVTLGNFAPAAATRACIEGTFGGGGGNTGGIGASICGNYSFGANLTNQSTYTPTATGSSVTIGGDDRVVGQPQSLVNSYSNMLLVPVPGAPAGSLWYCLSNSAFNGAPVADPASKCATPAASSFVVNGGYDFLFEITPPGANDDGPVVATEVAVEQIDHGPKVAAFFDVHLKQVAQVVERRRRLAEQTLLLD